MFTLSPVVYDGFFIHLTDAVEGEEFDLPARKVLVNPVGSSLETAAAHAVAHIRLRHHLTARGDFTEAQCDEADEVGQLVLLGSTWQLHPLELAHVAA